VDKRSNVSGLHGNVFRIDFRFQLCVFGLIDHAHPALAELLGDFVVADGWPITAR